MSTYHNIYQEKIDEEYNFLRQNKVQTDNIIYSNFYLTVVSTFKWENLPDTILDKMPEEQLCFAGKMAFFKDDNGDFKMYPCFMNGALRENGEYDSYMIIARNGKTWQRKRDDIEICYNNSMYMPSIPAIYELAEKASYALRSVETALERSMLPPVIFGEDNVELAKLADMYDKEKKLAPFWLALGKKFSADKHYIETFFDNQKEDVLARWDIFIRFRNLFYTTFGINNIEIMKKERLTEDEGSGNDEITRYTLLQDMSDCRQDFCDRVKEKFGYELSFYLNRDSNTVYETTLTNEEKIENIEIDLLKGVNYGNDDTTPADENGSKEPEKEVKE